MEGRRGGWRWGGSCLKEGRKIHPEKKEGMNSEQGKKRTQKNKKIPNVERKKKDEKERVSSIGHLTHAPGSPQQLQKFGARPQE